MIILPDTSVLIDGVLSNRIEKEELLPEKVLIHKASLAELEHQSNNNKTGGDLGLQEIKEIRELCEEKNVDFEFSGTRPSPSDIEYAEEGEIDSSIRNTAFEYGAKLYTSDKVQSKVGKAQGLEVEYIQPKVEDEEKLQLDRFFDEKTMSVHLKEDVEPMSKKGEPGEWGFEEVEDQKLTRKGIQKIAEEIVEQAKARKEGFIEIEKPGSTIIQLEEYRIVITRPPFSDKWEITAVRPVAKLSLEDYGLDEKLEKRLTEQAEGILIAGSPGEGKSTFARALAEHYASQDNIVKTIESPRDMLLSEEITQYAISKGDEEEVHDVLLLSRPDNTVFDEMRNTSDFELFTDLRLAGIGMMGIIHASDPIDAIERFIGRVELGVIPHIVDTVVYIEDGGVANVLSLNMVVKVPAGMTEDDLARPVVEVKDFETNKTTHEIYSYGEQTVVVPADEEKESKPLHYLAEQSIKEELQKYSQDVEVEMETDNKATVYIPEEKIPKLIGKNGKNIDKVEQEIGISIDVQELQQKNVKEKKPLDFEVDIGTNKVTFFLEESESDKEIDVYKEDKLLTTVQSSKKAKIKFNRGNKLANQIVKAINTGTIKLLSK